MVEPTSFRLSERTRRATAQLARFAVDTDHAALPTSVAGRLPTLLVDLVGVTVAGVRTPEVQTLLAAWHCPPGDAPVPGSSVRTSPETAAHLAATGACCLELDEGNKHAAGHPAAHVWFAAVAAAQLGDAPVSGPELLRAFALGYEVAARFGRATTRDSRWHTHGHWGATGAACAASLVLGSSAEQTAAAIDATSALMRVTPWANVLDGDFTRNLWIAGANTAGLDAARLARAGLVENRGNLAHSLGTLVGTLDTESLAVDLGARWLTAEGYVKLHAACSYTHPAIDLVAALRAGGSWSPDTVRRVTVRTHSLAGPLDRRHPRNRLSAMFSLPFVVANAVVNGAVDPTTMEPGSDAFAEAELYSERVDVVIDPALDGYLPDRRCTEVHLDLVDGTPLSLSSPNPVGDADHFPLGRVDVIEKIARLVGVDDARHVVEAVGALEVADDVRPVLADLALAGGGGWRTYRR